ILYVEVEGRRLLVPDNGCWTELARTAAQPPTVIRLAEPRFWRPTVSVTFHGRDVFAPVAGHLSLGLDPTQLGPRVTGWVRLETPVPKAVPGRRAGEVVFIDHFGNLITTLPGAALDEPDTRLLVGDHEIDRRARTYADVPPGTLVALRSSTGHVE